MASWVLKCPNCSSGFTHSQVEDTLENFFLASKPTFPDDGETLDCPHCGHTATYQQTDLSYRDRTK
jgi:DNA-directed RNA polymerase subunit RPC12/RpoP